MIEFASPLRLILAAGTGLAVLGIATVVIRRKRIRNGKAGVVGGASSAPPRFFLRSMMRALAILSLAVAAAGPSTKTPVAKQAVVLAVDLSRSMGAILKLETRAAEILRALPNNVDVQMIIFAGKPLPVSGGEAAEPDRRVEWASTISGLQSEVQPEHSDLAAAIRDATGRIPPEAEGHIILVSDGRATRGGAPSQASLAGQTGVAVHVAPHGAADADFRIDALNVPPVSISGEPLQIETRVSGTVQGEVHLTIRRSSAKRPIAERVLRVTRGEPIRIVVTDRPAGAGYARYEAEIVAEINEPGENNKMQAAVRLTGPARVIVVPAGGSSLRKNLSIAAGDRYRVESKAIGSLQGALDGVSAIVLEGSSRKQLNESTERRLAEYVSGGGGLLVIGGPSAFGAGGWSDDSPLPKVLPVSMKPGGSRRAVVVFVLDRSASMAEADGPGRTKLEFVRQATNSVLKNLDGRDRVSIVAFSDEAQLLLPAASPVEDREKIIATVNDLQTRGGGTDIVKALAEGSRVVASQKAQVRHVLVLSDGIDRGREDPSRELKRIVAQLAQSGVSLSTVGTGKPDNQDRAVLNIMKCGGGRLHLVADPARIPGIIEEDIQKMKREWIRPDPFTPRRSAAHAITAGLSDLPQLQTIRGRNRTTAKSRATVLLDSGPADEEEQFSDPLLAVWRFGLGRSAVITTTVGPPWAPWLGRPGGTERILEPCVRWLLQRHKSRGATTRIIREADRRWIETSVKNASGGPLHMMQLTVTTNRLPGPTEPADSIELTTPTAMVQVGLGRYRAPFVPSRSGLYRIEVFDAATGRPAEPLDETIHRMSYSDEMRRMDPDHDELARIAAAGGGRLIHDPHDLTEALAVKRTRRSSRPLAWLFLLVAAALYVSELAVRAAAAPHRKGTG